jgi:peroxiredoxin
LKSGDDAPDFTLPDQNGDDFVLSRMKGKRVLLSFHPLAWTSVCAKQMQSLEEHKAYFQNFNVVAVGVNVDPVPSKKAWAQSLDIESTPLVSDFWPHGRVARQYGLFNDQEGVSGRANIILDENQKIIFVKIYEISMVPDINEILDFLRELK